MIQRSTLRLRANLTLGFIEDDWLHFEVLEGLAFSETGRLNNKDPAEVWVEGSGRGNGAPKKRLCWLPLDHLLEGSNSHPFRVPDGECDLRKIIDKVKPVGLNICSFSLSMDPLTLKEENQAFESFVREICGHTEGVIIDHFAMFCMSFSSRRSMPQEQEGVRSFIGIHAVDLNGLFFVHSHGMAKFACPELEWCLPSECDPYMAGQVMNQIAGHMVDSSAKMEPGHTVRSEDGRIQLRLRPGIPHRDHDYGGNRVVRLEAMPGSEFFCEKENGKDRRTLQREEYFYGKRV